MERIFIHGSFFVKALQTRFWNYERFFTQASHFGDPKFAYFVYFPLLFSFSQRTGFQLLLAASISEFLNLILKWILQEGRPYWWVGENADKTGRLVLMQFPITCEAGPGSPSGHVMVSTAVFYVVVLSLVRNKSFLPRLFAWSAFLAIIGVISASRIFLAAHFPHQCLLGFTIGIALGKIASRLELSMLNSRHLISAGIVVLLTTVATYYLQEAMGIDPNNSVRLALKWCMKRSYVHLDTTPLFTSMRYTGTLLGCGIGVWRLPWGNYKANYSLPMAFLSATLGLAVCSIALPIPKNPMVAYGFNLTHHIALFIVLVRMIPELLIWAFNYCRCKSE